jgi:predicted aspartyl protease
VPIATLTLLTLAAMAQGTDLVHASSPSGACALAESAALDDASDALVDLPFRKVAGRIYLDATVNGQGPFVFALDTGASGIGRADASLVSALGLPDAGSGETSDGIATSTVDMVHIASLALGGLVHQNATVIARDYRSRVSAEAAFSGILGREFFADGLMVIDFPAGRLRFFADRELRADQSGAMAYDRAFRVPVTLGAVTTTGNLDTGADATLVMPPSVYESLGATPLQPAGNVALTNSRLPSFAGRFIGPARLGDAILTDIPVRVTEAFPEVLVGAHALQGQRVLIDQRHKTVAVCPVGPPAERDQ